MWCVKLKDALKSFAGNSSMWKWKATQDVPQADLDKRIYYFNGHAFNNRVGVASQRKTDYNETFFLSQLPGSVEAVHAGGYDQNDDRKNSETKSSGIKQQLLRKIATEVLLHRKLHGEVAVIQSDLQWYATGLPHSTIFAVMRFIGFPEEWIEFFKKSLEAPLNMAAASHDGQSKGPKTRKRGVPMAHAPEKLIGELVLFFLDIAVNQDSNLLLYRLHDDLWLAGDPKSCAKAWETMQTFAQVMGVEYNKNKTGSVYLVDNPSQKVESVARILPEGDVTIGFLTLNKNSGEWVIEQSQVDKHVEQLRKQLAACDSILSWVQTWNSCIGRFFGNTFGEPAHCFGRRHVDRILQVHERMQKALFDTNDSRGSTLTDYLKKKISSRFNMPNVPTAFLYMPEELGGLGLRNPFIPLLLVREQLKLEPEQYFQDFFNEEKDKFEADRKRFHNLNEKERRRRLKSAFATDESNFASNAEAQKLLQPDNFMAFEDFTKYRESTSPALCLLYTKLMEVPTENRGQLTAEVINAMDSQWKRLPDSNAEIDWIIQLHATELFETCGGMSLVEQSFLPLGVMTMMRQKKVTWTMVL
jgi:hypothetical protein